METFTYKSQSPEETMAVGQALARYLRPGDVITLEGDLGAGKTHFTKGVAKGLGITRVVNSPTFTIIKEYKGTFPLYHMDAYRLESEDEDLGFEEYFTGEGISVVEWPSKIDAMLPDEKLVIVMKLGEEVDTRLIHFTPVGDRYISLCKEFENR
ncbi:tRNA (adenosine(37)-N6)-threonylcarbamoyltransferase complex ATPase subunit type 1 TsaE [Alkalihalobacillus sp. LMS39]|uniref:tRNA (adenosine(37)-N6)-threonylcarbamoyltransferase complex ATPase subunit type 1 TsaE n=1 Tax=Alkalihalobacillus sp. LMS39 TaxID=2924032 RepID=UPI001FB21E6D|nr:tRNA (adenosine(37)-N6)-threonylcarbamoyltransferase complex ATPase subunit type 1 TsaE [Alkalihalobacillus sp. LMS39]UOE94374.1 tRNA (adenosine(37)-N6)-threonylcarbamoyltransferase complex ATPase subunit type 1 TsaE [Alkalihalobacillus sp. LMS39]